jgi:Zn-dependent protease with chaperone function
VTLLLVACGVVALVLPGVRPGRTLRGDPHWFARLDAAALVLGLTSLLLGLSVSVGVGAAHLAAGSTLWRYDGHLAPGGIVASALSAALLAFISWRLVTLARRGRQGRRLAHADGWLAQHEDLDDHELVVLATPLPLAYSVDGSPPQIVISEGLRDRLDDDMVGFVIDHERAHLRRRHRRYLLIAMATEALFAALPPIAGSALALRLVVERAADEEAAGPDRPQRDRAGLGLERLSTVGLAAGCAPEALRYRAQRLLAAPAPRLAKFELTAGAGLAALTALTFAVVAHATGDIPSLLATLRR